MEKNESKLYLFVSLKPPIEKLTYEEGGQCECPTEYTRAWK